MRAGAFIHSFGKPRVVLALSRARVLAPDTSGSHAEVAHAEWAIARQPPQSSPGARPQPERVSTDQGLR